MLFYQALLLASRPPGSTPGSFGSKQGTLTALSALDKLASLFNALSDEGGDSRASDASTGDIQGTAIVHFIFIAKQQITLGEALTKRAKRVATAGGAMSLLNPFHAALILAMAKVPRYRQSSIASVQALIHSVIRASARERDSRAVDVVVEDVISQWAGPQQGFDIKEFD